MSAFDLKTEKVAVLMGGASAEREVSLMSGSGVLQALQSLGVLAQPFDPAERDLIELKNEGFTRCFIALHGRYGEDGTVQGTLELFGIPYTGPGVMASSIAINKLMTKHIWRADGLPTPAWRKVDSAQATREAFQALGGPMIVKPAREGSSLGLTKVTSVEQCEAAFKLAAGMHDVVLCEQFIAGGVAFAGSDSYLSDEELKKTFVGCAPSTLPFEVPNYISPIAVVYNVEGVKSLNLDATTMAGIFAGTITKWNDAAIVALNAGTTLPDLAITAVHRSDKSGTTKNFTDYLATVAPKAWTAKAADVFPGTTGEGAQGTSGVISAVKNGKGTIGYADLSKATGLDIANVKVGDKFVAPSAAGAANAVAASTQVSGRDKGDLSFKINRSITDSNAYPLLS